MNTNSLSKERGNSFFFIDHFFSHSLHCNQQTRYHTGKYNTTTHKKPQKEGNSGMFVITNSHMLQIILFRSSLTTP